MSQPREPPPSSAQTHPTEPASLGHPYNHGVAVTTAVLLPVKAFGLAKRRLAPVLAPEARASLARAMATVVLQAAGSLPVAVVCDDAEVASWAEEQGADVVWAPGRGLDGAVSYGVSELATKGAAQIIVAHADLPLATDLTWVADFDGVTLVPDLRDDGTNVVCVPANVEFPFSYGPGSFARHVAATRHLGLALRVEREPLLGCDVDVPADLAHLGAMR